MTVSKADNFNGPTPNQPAAQSKFSSGVMNENPFAADLAAHMHLTDSSVSGVSNTMIQRVSSGGSGANNSSVMSGASSSFRARMAGGRM